MLAIQAKAVGGPEVLEVVDLPVPTPGPGQILLRQEAVGLNFIDTYFRSGLYPAKFPLTPGQEGAGVVEAVGEGVTRFQVGDRAGYGVGPGAGYAEYIALSEDRAVKLPEGVTARIAAGALLKGMTAEFLIRRCFPVAAGDAVLIHAAAGGVGLILCRHGMMVSFGNASGPAGPVEPSRLQRGGSQFLTRPTLFDYVTNAEELDDSAGALFEKILSGAVKIEIGAEFALKDAAKAHVALEARQTTGSTLLIP